MARNIPWNLLRQFVKGNIKDHERDELEKWQMASKANRLIFEEVLDDMELQNGLIDGKWDDVTRDWKAIAARIKPISLEFHFRKRVFYLVGSAAAAIILLMGISFGLIVKRNQQTGPQQTDGYSYIYSPRGQRTQVILPDQTKVWLNAESSLRYSTRFNETDREVMLEGEGYFEVSKDPDRPFFVKAGEVDVMVYGTSFNIKAFPEDDYIETTLIEGKLSVIPVELKDNPEREIMLEPNEKCIYQKTSTNDQSTEFTDRTVTSSSMSDDESIIHPLSDIPNIALARNAYIEPEKNWKDGKLIFKDETFGELEIKLERWFDVNIYFEDPDIKEFRFTGVFDKETINEAMEALKLSSQSSYNYEIQFGEIYLR